MKDESVAVIMLRCQMLRVRWPPNVGRQVAPDVAVIQWSFGIIPYSAGFQIVVTASENFGRVLAGGPAGKEAFNVLAAGA